jgi:hypothetical protein
LYGIQSIPALMYFVNGTVRTKIVGMVSPKAVLAKMNLLPPETPSTKAAEHPQQNNHARK